MIKGLSIATLIVVESGIPPCAEVGVAYKDPALTKHNGGKPYDALACQMYCETNPDCSFFTYYEESKDCWLLGSDAIRVPNVAGAVSGQEDCSHMLRGSTISIDEPNPLTKYPDVAVTPQALQRVVAADANNLIVDAGPTASSGFPFGWVLGGAACGLIAAGFGAFLLAKSEGSKARSQLSSSYVSSRGVKVESPETVDRVPLMEQGIKSSQSSQAQLFQPAPFQASLSVPPPSQAASVFTNPAQGAAAVPMVYYGGNGTQAQPHQFSQFYGYQ